MKAKLLVLFLCLFALSALAKTPSEVTQELLAIKAPQSASTLTVASAKQEIIAIRDCIEPLNCPTFWNSELDGLFDHMVKGETEWIMLTPDFLDVCFGPNCTEQLDNSLAQALLKSPEAVLSVASQKANTIGPICSFTPLDEDGLEWSKPKLRIYWKQAIIAVKSVTNPTLQSFKAICLKRLQKKQSYVGG